MYKNSCSQFDQGGCMTIQVLWWLFGCRHTIPPYLLNPQTIAHPDCASDDALRAVGFDGDSAEVAEKNARRRLAESISSSLQTVQVSTTEISQRQGEEEATATFDSVSTVESHFAYNHLIRTIEPIHQAKDGYRALACMAVSDLEKQMQIRHQQTSSELQRLYQLALDTDEMAAFAVLRASFQELSTPLLQEMKVLETLKDTPLHWGQQIQQQEQTLAKKAIDLRHQHPLYLQSTTSLQTIRNELVRVLKPQQIAVREGRCIDSNGLQGVLSVEQQSNKGPMGGFVVTTKVVMSLNSCETTTTPFTFVLVTGQGYHSTQEEQARLASVQGLQLKELPKEFGQVYPLD